MFSEPTARTNEIKTVALPSRCAACDESLQDPRGLTWTPSDEASRILSTEVKRGEDVAQLIEHRTGTPLTRFHSPVRQGNSLPEPTFSADSLAVSVHPRVQSHALTSVCTLKIQ